MAKKKRAHSTPEKRRQYHKDYYQKNREEKLKQSAAYNAGPGRTNHLAATRRWQKRNKSRVAAYQAVRKRASSRKLWGSKPAIDALYALAVTMTGLFGKPYQVDHYYPLKGKKVCGLHVERNLQVISRKENIKKSNAMPKASNGTLQLLAAVAQLKHGRVKTCEGVAGNKGRGAVARRGRGAARVLRTPRKPADAPVQRKQAEGRNSSRARGR